MNSSENGQECWRSRSVARAESPTSWPDLALRWWVGLEVEQQQTRHRGHLVRLQPGRTDLQRDLVYRVTRDTSGGRARLVRQDHQTSGNCGRDDV